MINGNLPTRFGVTRTYTKFIVGFVILTVILIAIIFYFSFSNGLIQIVPRVTPVSSDFIADIETQSTTVSAGSLPGILFETEVEETVSFDATGTKDLEGDVIGTVTIYNNLDRVQPLVEKTRILTKDGILLRLKKRVEVPANGKIDVEIYADDPSAFETLAPTQFTIPGLNATLQKEVYAESKATISSKPGAVKVVKAVDLAQAKESLAEILYQQAIDKFELEMDNDYIAVPVAKKILDEKVGAEVDSVADKFEVTQKMKITIMGISQKDILALAVERLNQLVSKDLELTNIKSENLSYVVQNYNEANKTANIKIHAEGETILKETSEILDKEKLAGLSARGVELYLGSYDEIERVQVVLSPFWVKNVPQMIDHITIEIVKE